MNIFNHMYCRSTYQATAFAELGESANDVQRQNLYAAIDQFYKESVSPLVIEPEASPSSVCYDRRLLTKKLPEYSQEPTKGGCHKDVSWLTTLLLKPSLSKQPLWLRSIFWEIGYHLSLTSINSSYFGDSLLKELRSDRPEAEAYKPSPEWCRAWFALRENRQGAEKILYGNPSIDLSYIFCALKDAEKILESKPPLNILDLVALRRLVDTMLDSPKSLKEALVAHRTLLLRVAPDKNRERYEKNGPEKAMINYYYKIVQDLKCILKDPHYKDAIFMVPPGMLGLKKHHESFHVSKKTLAVIWRIGSLAAAGLGFGLAFVIDPSNAGILSVVTIYALMRAEYQVKFKHAGFLGSSLELPKSGVRRFLLQVADVFFDAVPNWLHRHIGSRFEFSFRRPPHADEQASTQAQPEKKIDKTL